MSTLRRVVGAASRAVATATGWWRDRSRPDRERCVGAAMPWSWRLRLGTGRILLRDGGAYKRGMTLLLEHLSPNQRKEFLRLGHFHVIGGTTGKRYRISRGRQMNVHQLDI